MSSILKPFILVFLLSFSVCEKSRIKRAPQGILPKVLDDIICGCSESPTCPQPTTCPETPTCPEPPTLPNCPENPLELCSDTYYCASNISCITTRFAATKASVALDKCSSLSNENVTFVVGYLQADEDDEVLKCLSAALPASGIPSPQEFWAITRSDFEKNQCYVYNIETDGEDKVIQTNFSEQVSCKKEEYPFYCLGFFSIDGA
ncbi:UNVERIFIED_CONTAM: hypothetical protein RMT77_013621 [Armadillidium vulgare]